MSRDDADKPGPPPPTTTPPVVPLAAPKATGLRLVHLMSLVVAAALFLWLVALAGAWLVVGSVVVLVAGAIGLAVVLAGRGATSQETVLRAMAVAADRSLPLGPAALAFSDQYGRSFRWRTRLLAQLMDEGQSLPDALEQVPGLVGRESESLVRAGWHAGALPQALRMAASARTTRLALYGSVLGRLAYLLAVVVAAQTILGFLLYFIVPKFEAIFKDFGVALPGVTVATIRAAHLAITWAWPVALLFAAEVFFLVLAPVLILGSVNARVPWGGRFTLLGRLAGFLSTRNVPVLGRFVRARHSALMMRALSLWVEGGKPVEAGLELLAKEFPSPAVARRLRSVATDVRLGEDWVVALLNRGLIGRSDYAVIESAKRVGNLAWALRETASSHERRSAYRLQLWVQLLFPVAVMALGSIVFFVSVSFFMPLVALIEALAA